MKHLKKIQSVSEITPKDYMVIYSTEEKVFCKGSEPSPQFEMVDLGLPSGLKWASCNVGATKPEEYGLYFQWGDTVGYEGDEAKAHSTWDTCPFNNGSSSFDKTYFDSVKDTVCPNGVLSLEYDAANAHMGNGWRMPTRDEVKELISNTTSTWYASGNTEFNGVAGRKFTASNGKSIFVPASGYFSIGNHFRPGSFGYFLSNTLTSSYPYHAIGLDFDSSDLFASNITLCYGIPVRGVHA